jgi:hypothetical protein
MIKKCLPNHVSSHRYSEHLIYNVHPKHQPYTLHIEQKRQSRFIHLRHVRTNSILSNGLNEAMLAAASKVIANTLCYPIESIRLWNISNTKVQLSIPNLMLGYNIYLPYCIINNVITFNIFYNFNNFLCTCLPLLSLEHRMFMVSCMTCIVCTVYKVPTSYYIKQTVMNKIPCFKIFNDFQYIRKSYMAVLLEDIPELFIKFYLNEYLIMNFSLMNPLIKSSIISIISTIIMTPIEFFKTSIICHNIKLDLTKFSILTRISSAVLNTFLFFIILDTLKSL